MSSHVASTAIRGRFLDFPNTVQHRDELAQQVRYLEDGLLLTHDGKICWFGPWTEGKAHLPGQLAVTHYPEQLIIPGLIDSHVHFPQTEMIGTCSKGLLNWLYQHTFPTEMQFQDKAYAEQMAAFFL